MQRNRRARFSVIFFVVAALALAGCGDKDDKSQKSDQKLSENPKFQVIHQDEVAKSLLTISPWSLLLLLSDRLDPSSRVNALYDITLAMAETGNIPQALAIANKLDGIQKSRALHGIAKVMLEVKDLQQALAIADQLNDEDKAQATLEIAVAMAQGGNVPQALALTQKLTGIQRAQALYAVINALITANQSQPALELLPQAMAAAIADRAEDADKIYALRSNAEILNRVGDSPRALTLLTQALAVTDRMRGKERFDALYHLAFAVVTAGDLQRGLYIASQMDPDGKAWTLSGMAIILAQKGDLRSAMMLANQLGPRDKVGTLTKIAAAALQTGDQQHPVEILTQALTMVNELDDFYKTDMLIDIAVTLTQAGNLQQALAVANQISGKEKVWALNSIALALAEGDNKQRALEILSQALECATSPEEKTIAAQRAYALYAIAQSLVKIDITPQTPAFSDESQRLAETILSLLSQ